MKKIIAIFLAVLMLLSVSVSGLSAFAADGEVRLVATDSNPISLKEVEATKYFPSFDLETSEIDYGFNVILPDGSVQELITEYEVGADGTAGTGTATESGASKRYFTHGNASVNLDEAAEAKASGSLTVPVHVDVYVSVYSAEHNAYISFGNYQFVIYKRLVDSYIRSITPVSGEPAYIYEKSDAVNFENTVFEIEYWDFSKKTVKAETLLPVYIKPVYTLEGIPFRYVVNRDTKNIYISYVDGTCMFDYQTEKEFPFSSIEILGCTLEGDMPTSVNYKITWKDGSKTEYTSPIGRYSGYINFIDGYYVEVVTEGSKYVSTVEINIGGSLSHSKTYELEQQSFFARLIAKLVWFFKQLFSAGIF